LLIKYKGEGEDIMKKSDMCFIGAVASGIAFVFTKSPFIVIPFLVCGLGMLYFRKKDD
jgi:hypothetical protein